jgi:hypothetical protein
VRNVVSLFYPSRASVETCDAAMMSHEKVALPSDSITAQHQVIALEKRPASKLRAAVELWLDFYFFPQTPIRSGRLRRSNADALA